MTATERARAVDEPPRAVAERRPPRAIAGKRRRDPRASEEAWLRRGAAVLGVAAVAAFVAVHVLEGEVRPSGSAGTAFGITATALLVLAMLYAARRRAMPVASKRRLGLSRTWLLVHVYGSLLFLLAVLLHSGLRFPEGLLSWSLWLLSLWTVASGLLGLLAQRLVPRMLTSATNIEAHYERIPALVDELQRRGDAVAAACEPPLRLYYSRRLAPALAAPSRVGAALSGAGKAARRLEPLEHLRGLVSGEELERVDELERLYAAKLDLDTHYAWQTVLRAWLWLHVPPAVLLLLLVILHITTVLAY